MLDVFLSRIHYFFAIILLLPGSFITRKSFDSPQEPSTAIYSIEFFKHIFRNTKLMI